MEIFRAKYGVAFDVGPFVIQKRSFPDWAASGDWTPATGDTKISKDYGNVANATNNPAAIGGTGSTGWKLTLTSTEMQAARIFGQVVDAATKAVEDYAFVVVTYGHPSAADPFDFSKSLFDQLQPDAGIAQAGGGNSITLRAGAPSFDLTGYVVCTGAGTGKEQFRRITAYNTTTKVATVASAWDVVPDNTTDYVVIIA